MQSNGETEANAKTVEMKYKVLIVYTEVDVALNHCYTFIMML